MKDQFASRDELVSFEELISLSLHIVNKLQERKQESNSSFHWPSLLVFLVTTPAVLLLVQPPVSTAPIEGGEPEDTCGTSNHLVSSWPKKGKGAICQ